MKRQSSPRVFALISGFALSGAASLGLAMHVNHVEAAAPVGIDVSAWQGSTINWSAVAGSGISFAYIRAAEGSGYVDGTFRANWYRATAAGVVPGAYLYFHPADDPVAQARVLLNELKSVNFTHGDLLPAIDVEVTDGQPPGVIVANLQTLVNALVTSLNSYPVIYTSPAWWDGHVGSTAFAADPLWVAHWGVSSPSVPAHNWAGNGWQVWQYANNGSVPGIAGRIDMDRVGGRPLPYFGSAGLVPQQSTLAIGARNVAGIPQAVSDQPGDIDVVWRGTDNRLWTIGYRGGQWAAQAIAITPANVSTDPSLVSTGPGDIDAFWQGSDGALWHVQYKGGFYGRGAWAPPISLGLGPLGSAPRAISAGHSVDVYWRGQDSHLHAAHVTDVAVTPIAYGANTVAGEPAPVYVGNGASEVFWRDGGGGLWMQSMMTWGAGAPSRIAATMPSDPTAVSAGDGDAQVFWRGSDSAPWTLGVNNGSPGQPTLLSSQPILGRPGVVETSQAVTALVLQRTDGRVATMLGLPGIGWVGPELLGDGPVGSDPYVVGYATQAFSTFWRGQDGGLWTSEACPGCAFAPPAPATTLPFALLP